MHIYAQSWDIVEFRNVYHRRFENFQIKGRGELVSTLVSGCICILSYFWYGMLIKTVRWAPRRQQIKTVRWAPRRQQIKTVRWAPRRQQIKTVRWAPRWQHTSIEESVLIADCYRMDSKVWLVWLLKLNVVRLMCDAIIFLGCSHVFARGSCVCLPSRPWGSWLMLQKPLPQMQM